MEISELFNQLESNQPHVVEEIKKTFHENFNAIKDSWLVNGLFDYYVSTSSMRSVEILVGVREPHDKHLFDKITDALKGPLKLQALTLLGHVVRRHPTWVYKITQHQIMKELLKLLKAETDILCLMSAVLVLIVLLPMIPALMGPHLQDVFEVFSRLASWNTNNPTKLPEEHLLHLQVSLYALFHRLYGMYPCNFISFLRSEYGMREHLGIFSHTIKPMLETVRMHPLLVTASKDAEIATTRWKKMEDHDVIVECAKYAIDSMEKSREEGNFRSINTFRSRGSFEHSVSLDISYKHSFTTTLPLSAASGYFSTHAPLDQELWSPSIYSGLSTPPIEESAPTSIPQTPNSQNFIVSTSLPHQEGTSPPEAAIEATPETTPVKGGSCDVRQCDSVLQEVHPPHVGDYEECQQETGSPCTSGGLHMPNSRSMLDFARRVHHRQRFYSQCVPETNNDTMAGLSTGSSPGQGSTFPLQDRVRRANSCPEMKKVPGLPTAEINISRPLDETEEFEEAEGMTAQTDQSSLVPNGKIDDNRLKECEVLNQRLLSASTQTVDWVPLPYEHLFLSIFPPTVQSCDIKSSSAPSPAPPHHQTDPPFQRLSPYTMVDKYIETVVQGQEAKKPKHAGTETEIKILKEQLVLLNIQLHFERQRREVHSERNRRLLGKSRSNRELDEHNLALQDQLSLLQKDIEQLHSELDKCKKESRFKEIQMQETTTYWQNQCTTKQKEAVDLLTVNQLLQQEVKEENVKNVLLVKEMQEAEAKLFDLGNEMKQALAQVVVGEQLKESVEQLQKKLLLMGELQQRYRDRFAQLSLQKCPDEEVTLLQENYVSEVQSLQEMLEVRGATLEAAKARISDLESVLSRKDVLIAEQKRILRSLEEEYDNKLEAVENKYNAQRAVNKKMEEHILELYHRIDVVEERRRKEQHSPDSSAGCQEALAGSVDSGERALGPSSFSPHNSPLSQSLSSPGGLSMSAILGRDCVEMKNLQVIVDQPERAAVVSSGGASPAVEQGAALSPGSSAGASAPGEEG